MGEPVPHHPHVMPNISTTAPALIDEDHGQGYMAGRDPRPLAPDPWPRPLVP